MREIKKTHSLGRLLLFFLIFSLGLSSCITQKIYTPALYHTDISYLPKPSSGDSIHHQTYISGGWTSVTGFYGTNQINLYQVHASEGWIFKDINLGVGGYAGLGSLQNSVYTPDSLKSRNPYYFDNKGFSTLGAHFSLNLYEKAGDFNFRIIGVEASYSHESGDYLTYRKAILNVPGYYTTTQNNLFTLGGTTEIIYEGEKHPYNKIGLRIFVGQTFGNFDFIQVAKIGQNSVRKPAFLTYALYLQSKRYFFIFEGSGSNTGFEASRFRLGYHF